MPANVRNRINKKSENWQMGVKAFVYVCVCVCVCGGGVGRVLIIN